MEPVDLLGSSGSTDGSWAAFEANTVYKFTVPGEPRAWKRPEAFVKESNTVGEDGNRRKGTWHRKNVVDTNKDEKKTIVEVATQQLQQQHDTLEFPICKEEPVTVCIEFHRRLPNTAFVGDKRKNCLRKAYLGANNMEDNMKPDLDNLVKLVKDALQGLAYKDDKQVVVLHAYKMLDLMPPHNGRTVVKFSQTNGNDLPTELD